MGFSRFSIERNGAAIELTRTELGAAYSAALDSALRERRIALSAVAGLCFKERGFLQELAALGEGGASDFRDVESIAANRLALCPQAVAEAASRHEGGATVAAAVMRSYGGGELEGARYLIAGPTPEDVLASHPDLSPLEAQAVAEHACENLSYSTALRDLVADQLEAEARTCRESRQDAGGPALPKEARVGKWRVALVYPGQAYGLTGSLTYSPEEAARYGMGLPLVEFYDLSSDPARFPGGQFVSRYYASTLLGIDASDPFGRRIGEDAGLCLDGGVPSWSLSKREARDVASFLDGVAAALGAGGATPPKALAEGARDAAARSLAEGGRAPARHGL